ncbi:hypothetical protein EDD21DRAFT_381011, partial [Dissophora ornata]
MSYDSLWELLDEVVDHDIFKSASYSEQEEVAAQLVVTPDRLGHSGSGTEGTRLGIFWDRSVGPCQKYIERVLVALMSLQPRYLTRPTQAQRQTHAAWVSSMGPLSHSLSVQPTKGIYITIVMVGIRITCKLCVILTDASSCYSLAILVKRCHRIRVVLLCELDC